MPCFVCTTCGVQYAETDRPPARCPVCEDERQYVGWDGQQWTTLDALRTGHANAFRDEGPGLIGIGTEPTFAIGQRALVVRDSGFPLLWDCVTLIDDATVTAVRTAGGIRAIAISHPHYYSAVVEWARAFEVPAYLHVADRAWVMRPDPAIVLWEGETLAVAEGITLIRCGGHFPGATVLHWAAGADGGGALLSGDVLQVGQDRRSVSFMYSYPNYIPLDGVAVRRLADALVPYRFEQIYGAFWRRNVTADGSGVVRRSVERYQRAIGI
jgi:glyoxylase-like metal-dependent hydrolase (beta-lactamase superfamily II)